MLEDLYREATRAGWFPLVDRWAEHHDADRHWYGNTKHSAPGDVSVGKKLHSAK